MLTGATVYDCGRPTGRARLGFAMTGARALARRSASFWETDEMAPLWEAEGRWARVEAWEEERPRWEDEFLRTLVQLG